MIVKTGRLYLWNNDISSKTLEIRVGTGSGSSEYVEINDTDLADQYTDATVLVTDQAGYDQWLIDGLIGNWSTSIPDITTHIDSVNRKIIIYIMIDASNQAFELGEIGLFIKEIDNWTGVLITTTQPVSPINGTLWNDSDVLNIYTVTETELDNTIPTVSPGEDGSTYPVSGDQWFDSTTPGSGTGTLYTCETNYTWTGATTEEISTSQPVSPIEGDKWFNINDPGSGTGTLYEYIGAWELEGSATTEPTTPSVDDTWFDVTTSTYYTYTLDTESIIISRNLISKQFISTSETKIIKYTINI